MAVGYPELFNVGEEAQPERQNEMPKRCHPSLTDRGVKDGAPAIVIQG